MYSKLGSKLAYAYAEEINFHVLQSHMVSCTSAIAFLWNVCHKGLYVFTSDGSHYIWELMNLIKIQWKLTN